MVGKAGRPGYDELAAQVGDLREMVRGLKAENTRLRAELAAVLRTKLRLPLAQVQWLLDQVWGRHLSVGELSGLLAEAARAGRGAYDHLLAEARASPVAHLDETGWRQDGRNGFIWTVTTPRVRFFPFSSSRAGAGARRLVGPEYEGVVGSDFATAYDQRDGRHQRCWAHFLRDIHDLKEANPDHAALHAWGAEVHALNERAASTATALAGRGPKEREVARLGFERELLALCRAQGARAPHAALCQRGERYHPEFFTFVAEPAVPPTNNAAERALRPLVIARKISGGTRSTQGSQTRMVLQSLVATWELRGQDPGAALVDLLGRPRSTTTAFTPV